MATLEIIAAIILGLVFLALAVAVLAVAGAALLALFTSEGEGGPERDDR